MMRIQITIFFVLVTGYLDDFYCKKVVLRIYFDKLDIAVAFYQPSLLHVLNISIMTCNRAFFSS